MLKTEGGLARVNMVHAHGNKKEGGFPWAERGVMYMRGVGCDKERCMHAHVKKRDMHMCGREGE